MNCRMYKYYFFFLKTCANTDRTLLSEMEREGEREREGWDVPLVHNAEGCIMFPGKPA